MPGPRTIDEFNVAAKTHMRRLMIFFGVSIAGLFACLIVGVVIRETAYATVRDRLGEVGYEVFNVSLLLSGMTIFLVGAWLGYRRGGRDPRLHCPHCGAMLVEAQSIVIATRNCTKCGRRVLAEPES